MEISRISAKLDTFDLDSTVFWFGVIKFGDSVHYGIIFGDLRFMGQQGFSTIWLLNFECNSKTRSVASKPTGFPVHEWPVDGCIVRFGKLEGNSNYSADTENFGLFSSFWTRVTPS